jgi:hypothetical protein
MMNEDRDRGAARAPDRDDPDASPPEVEAHAMPVLDAQGMRQPGTGTDAETGHCTSILSIIFPD